MAAILYKAWEGYNVLFEELPDPRTKPWLFVAKPYQGLLLLGLYLMFVLNWGPKWMKNRPAFNLDKVLIVYNALQVISCSYVFTLAIHYAWGWDYKWICEPVDLSHNPKAIKIAHAVYFYFALKVVDLLDTVFFVLRKKINQISFLHIYHHTGMVLLIWGAVTYLPGGHGTFIGVINCFVHMVMYSYYLLTVLQPSYKQSCWWKKYITQLQIIQFFLCVVHMASIVFKPDCEYPRWTSAIFLPQNLFMLVLFIDFYIKTYIKKPSLKETCISGLDCKSNNLNESNNLINGESNGLNGANDFGNEKFDKYDYTQGYFNGDSTDFDNNIKSADVNMNNSRLSVTNGFNNSNTNNSKKNYIIEEADLKSNGFSSKIEKFHKYDKTD